MSRYFLVNYFYTHTGKTHSIGIQHDILRTQIEPSTLETAQLPVRFLLQPELASFDWEQLCGPAKYVFAK